MKREYHDLRERIAHYRAHEMKEYRVIREEHYREYLSKHNNTIAEDRPLSDDFAIFLSVYDQTGLEYNNSRSAEIPLLIRHTLPYQGILHKHEYIEILYVIEGSFDQILTGQQRHFTAGEFVITDQNTEHADLLLPVDAAVIFLQIGASYMDELLQSYDERDELQRFLFHALNRQKREQSYLELKRDEDMAGPADPGEEAQLLILLETLCPEQEACAPGYEDVRRGLLLRLLHHLCRDYTPILHSETREGKEKALLYELERYIRLHYDTVSSAELETVFHYHRNYYNLLLQKYRGRSFKQYLLEVRMARARQLLTETALPVKEVARQVGYENTSHFYHLYERTYGQAPRGREKGFTLSGQVT